MSTIEFVVRGATGAISRGFTGEGGAASILAGVGSDTSLRLDQSQVVAYDRVGNALEITLVDGQVLVIDNFYGVDGIPTSDLFLSTNGQMVEVNLAEGAEGAYYSNYVQEEAVGKWAGDDDLYFMGDAPVLLAGIADETSRFGGELLGAIPLVPVILGAGAVAAVPLLDDDDVVLDDDFTRDKLTGTLESRLPVNGEDRLDGVDISGTGTPPGAVVVVEIGGATQETVVDENGNWTVTFPAEDIPEGTYETDINATLTLGEETINLVGILVVDTEAFVTFDGASVGGDGTVNADEASDAVMLSGTTEPGSSVFVTVNGVEYEAQVDDGEWWIWLPAEDIAPGEYSQDVSVRATDPLGNTASTTGSFAVDTTTFVTMDTSTVEGDGLINADERSDGVTVTGTAEPGASVEVTFGGTSATVTVIASDDGTWSANFTAEQVPQGETTETIVAVATDLAGNTASTSGEVNIDTEVTDLGIGDPADRDDLTTGPVATDNVIDGKEQGEAITVVGTVEPGSVVNVNLAGVELPATVDDDGNWTVTYPPGVVPPGDYDTKIVVTATDDAGNTETVSDDVRVDTTIALTLNTPIEGDDVINGVEAKDGVVLSGSTDPDATVEVTFAGKTQTTTAASDGTWSVSYAADDIPAGESMEDISVRATDVVGNTASVDADVQVDTIVNNLTLDRASEGDVVNGAEASDGIRFTGTVEQGSSVLVTFEGTSRAATVASDGTWSVDFTAAEIPPGEYTATVKADATDAHGNTASISDTYSIDTTIGVTLATPIEGDNVINGAEASDGVVLTGTSDPGATVFVTFAGATRTTTAGADGTWSVSYAAGDIPAGESMETVSVRATDVAGNEASTGADVRVDTIVNNLTMVGPTDGTLVNRAEASDGITLTGTVEQGSTVLVTFEGVTRAATVAADGSWSVDYSAAEVPQGEYTATVQVAATDRYGNTASTSDDYTIDTTPPEAPLIGSYTRSGAGVRAFSTSITTDTIELSSVAEDGTTGTVTATVTQNPVFNELDFDFTSTVPNGSHLIINASDAAGNETATLFVLEQSGTNVLDIANPGLDAFDIEGIDMQFAEDTELTLTASDLEALCQHSDTVTIHGGVDDTVTILGATATGVTSDIGGRTYDHYSLGDSGSLIIDDSITVVT